jgi:hypothetical protein
MNKLIGVFLLLIGFCACSEIVEATTQRQYYIVEYIVEGDLPYQCADIVINNAQGGTEMISGVYLTWSKKIEVPEGHFVYLSAQNNGEAGGVTVIIKLNGVEVKRSYSSGAYVIATASGRL